MEVRLLSIWKNIRKGDWAKYPNIKPYSDTIHLEHIDAKSHHDLPIAFKICHKITNYAESTVICFKCACKERNIFSLNFTCRNSCTLKLFCCSQSAPVSPRLPRGDEPCCDTRKVWAEKWEVLAHGQTSLLPLRIPKKQSQRLIIRRQLLLLVATCNLDSERLDPFPALQWKTLRGCLCSIYKARAKAPEDTQQENIVRQDCHAKTREFFNHLFLPIEAKPSKWRLT